MRTGKNTGKHVQFNRGPQGNVGIKCKQFGFCAKITGLTPNGSAMNSGKLAVGDVIEAVDDESLAFLSLAEIDQRFKGQPGSMITLHVHSEKAIAYLEAQDMPNGAKDVGNRVGEGKVPLNECERAVSYLEAQKAGTSCDIPPSREMFRAMKSGESQDDTNLLHNSTCAAASQPQLPQTLGKHSLALSPALNLRNMCLCVLRMQMHFSYSCVRL
jgi:hypothetical protein